MNLADWKAKWYPVPAQACNAADALDHSILKWTGLLEKNREGLELVGSILADRGREDVLEINHTSCALCVVHYRPEIEEDPCRQCPLALSRRGVSCDQVCEGEDYSPWQDWLEDHDAQPMLTALHKAKVWVLEQSK